MISLLKNSFQNKIIYNRQKKPNCQLCEELCYTLHRPIEHYRPLLTLIGLKAFRYWISFHPFCAFSSLYRVAASYRTFIFEILFFARLVAFPHICKWTWIMEYGKWNIWITYNKNGHYFNKLISSQIDYIPNYIT